VRAGHLPDPLSVRKQIRASPVVLVAPIPVAGASPHLTLSGSEIPSAAERQRPAIG
jgi:hypothetical protein